MKTIDKIDNYLKEGKKKKKPKKKRQVKGVIKYCNNCQRPISDDFPYCPECGMDV